jgi:hypothetical protein
MQDHPGQWMIINRYATHDGCSNTRAQLRKDGFEAVARATERRNGRRVELWARWPGV